MSKRLRSGLIIGGFVTGVPQAISIASMIVVARTLGPIDFGKFALFTTLAITISSVVGSPAANLTLRYLSDVGLTETEKRSTIVHLLILSILLLVPVLPIFLLGYPRVSIAFDDPASFQSFRLALLSAPILVAEAFMRSVIVARGLFRPLAWMVLISVLPTLPLYLILTWAAGLTGATASFLALAIMRSLLLAFLLKPKAETIFADATGLSMAALRLIAFTAWAPALIAAVTVAPAHWVVQAILAHSAPAGLSAVGLFYIGLQAFNATTFLPNAAMTLNVIELNSAASKGDRNAVLRFLTWSWRAVALICVPLLLVSLLWGDTFVNVYHPELSDSRHVIFLGCLAGLLMALAQPVGSVLLARSRFWSAALLNAAWSLVYIVGTVLLLPLGAAGALTSLATSYVALLSVELFAALTLIRSMQSAP